MPDPKTYAERVGRRRDPRWRKLMAWRKRGGTGCRCEWCTGAKARLLADAAQREARKRETA